MIIGEGQTVSREHGQRAGSTGKEASVIMADRLF
jgi:hypothetical protein